MFRRQQVARYSGDRMRTLQIAPALIASLRPYQVRVVEDVGQDNAIVKMPTGSGKTLVAAECIRRCLSQRARDQSEKKWAVFFVPTCDLVEQQAVVLRKWCGQEGVAEFRAAEYMAGAQVPSLSLHEAVVATPEAFRRLQMRNSDFGWHRVAIVVFDEVHHVLKDHPYRHLAHGLRSHVEGSQQVDEKPQVLGLSASLTYAVGDADVQRALQGLSRDLGLVRMLNVDDDELRRGGYDPPGQAVEIAHPCVLPEGIAPEAERKPHLMHQVFFSRIKTQQATPFAHLLIRVVEGLEVVTRSRVPDFTSPLRQGQRLAAWEELAHDLCRRERDPTTKACLEQLEVWYVALRVLVQTWEEQEQIVLHWLITERAFDRLAALAVDLPPDMVNAYESIREMADNACNLSKVACLKAQLFSKHDVFGNEFRAIVFAQQRITAYILAHFINHDEDLRGVGLRAGYVTARGVDITPSISVSSGAAKESLGKFRAGEVNVLVATSVAEEGLDVPAANVVISFDPLKDSVELAQRFGRARQADRRIVVMDQRRDRPIEFLEAVRREQEALIARFEPAQGALDVRKEEDAQRSRERGARAVLLTAIDDKNCLQTLNLYIKKTKARISEVAEKRGGQWAHTWSYSTVLRELVAEGVAGKKDVARKIGAKNLLEQLRAEANRSP